MDQLDTYFAVRTARVMSRRPSIDEDDEDSEGESFHAMEQLSKVLSKMENSNTKNSITQSNIDSATKEANAKAGEVKKEDQKTKAVEDTKQTKGPTSGAARLSFL